MTDSACACSATNTLQNEIDEVTIAVSDLQNLAYIQQLVLSERMQEPSGRDALLTLHYAFRDRLEALEKACGTLSKAHLHPKRAGAFRGFAGSGVDRPQPINLTVPS
ncbi:hypothetical protein SAMN04488518_106243 [Pseudovibrio ascidiaceicola]|uniref:Uncharacterized protein n=1 Tax=Pseudovibrio ascidiaceicola TaxID=285279 RepID=A0A1I4AL68_9HYPH|nr:hypothetical protein [Pseudovibrio ascidiaceicola]SFK56499.1 hypothetical protein SAMN04488518_106243 [Pseudovibrio ascidiaceicola]